MIVNISSHAMERINTRNITLTNSAEVTAAINRRTLRDGKYNVLIKYVPFVTVSEDVRGDMLVAVVYVERDEARVATVLLARKNSHSTYNRVV